MHPFTLLVFLLATSNALPSSPTIPAALDVQTPLPGANVHDNHIAQLRRHIPTPTRTPKRLLPFYAALAQELAAMQQG